MTVPLPPLASRMRPKALDEVIGQDHLIAHDAPFRRSVESGQVQSVLLWGPPGTGKTTIARLVADVAGMDFRHLSAVTSGMKDLREIIAASRAATDGGGLFGRQGLLEPQGTTTGVILFVDEIHRWNKAQQDALLPHVEDGTVVLIGATTENPAFEVIPALRSRCWLLQLHPLARESLVEVMENALTDSDRGLGGQASATPEALLAIAHAASGDARRALSMLERAIQLAGPEQHLDLPALERLAERPDLLHDASGDAHFDVLSAFIKSMRGSDPDAALYWMARLIAAGEDPMLIARRIVVLASEDVGNADPRALTLAVSAMQGVHMIGMPEARILLAQACTYVSTAPKSNASYKALNDATALVETTGGLPVPVHLRNAPTRLAKALGHGATYLYPHDHPGNIVAQDYLPESLAPTRFYEPTPHGTEKTIGERLRWWRDKLNQKG